MTSDFIFAIDSIAFDENYHPSDNTRATTNFANLARGDSRQQNLRNTLKMMTIRSNALAHCDNPNGVRYSVELQILSVDMTVDHRGTADSFPAIEVLKTSIVDHHTNVRIEGV